MDGIFQHPELRGLAWMGFTISRCRGINVENIALLLIKPTFKNHF